MALPIYDSDRRFMDLYPSGIPLNEMIPFYEAVSRDEPIKLEWVCPGKRNPKEEVKQAPVVSQESTSVTPEKPSDSQPQSKRTEFDFDEEANQTELPLFPGSVAGGPVGIAQAAALPLRRVVGPVRHPRQPRVANMDKILSDLFKSRKETSTPTQPAPEASTTSATAPNTVHQESSAYNEHDQPDPAPAPTDTACSELHTEVDNVDPAPLPVSVSFETPMEVGDVAVSNTTAQIPETLHQSNIEPAAPSAAEEHFVLQTTEFVQPNTECVEKPPVIAVSDSTVPNSTQSPIPVTVSKPLVSELPEQMARTQLMDQSSLVE